MGEPVVTVTSSIEGTMVRWHRTLDDAQNMRPMLVATRNGVTVGHDRYLTDVPEEWEAAARAAWRALKDGGDVSHLATHRSRFDGGGGPLDPVTKDATPA